MNRRDFLLGVLKAGGAAALMPALVHADLLAIPPASPIDVPELEAVAPVWTWDGSASDYLKRLNLLAADHLRVAGVSLVHAPTLEKLGYQECAYTATDQINMGFELPLEFLYGAAGKLEHRKIEAIRGMQLGVNRGDPVGQIDAVAAAFAAGIVGAKAEAYGDLELPMAVHQAARYGMFRLVAAYHVLTDQYVMRLDTLVGRRLSPKES